MTIKHLYPVIEPSLNLDFANSKKLDPRITFTRGSIGTYVGDDGLIKTAAQNEARFDHDSDGNSLGLLVEESRTNLLLRSEEFDQAAWIAQNGYSVRANQAIAPDGTLTADAVSRTNASTQYLYQNITQSGTLTFSCWVKTASGTATFQLSSYNSTDGVKNSGDLTATTTWQRFSFTVTQSGVTTAWYPCNGAINTTFYIWGAQLETDSFPTSYIPTEGSTVTRAADVAGIYDDNFGVFRTNLLQYSEEFDAASWTTNAQNVSVTANQAVAPNGLTTADLLLNTTANQGFLQQNTTVADATQLYTFSVYVKNNGAAQARILTVDGSSSGARFTFTFATEAVLIQNVGANGADASGSVEKLSDGWYRFILTGRTTAAGTLRLSQISCAKTAYGTADEDGTSGIYIWGAQLEEGSTATDYIKSDVNFVSRASSATYYDANGVIQTAAVDEARTAAYLPDGSGNFVSAGPLLLEDAGTNLLLRSEEFDQAAWTDAGTFTWTPSTDLAPDGSLTVDKPSVVFTHWAFYDATNLAFLSGYPAAFPFTVTSSWTRQSVTITAPAGCTSLRFYPGRVGGAGSYFYQSVTVTPGTTYTASAYYKLDSASSTVLIWGAQLEANSYPTSYIPTTSSTATRAADVSTSAAASVFESDWYRQDEGTIFADSQTPYPVASGKYPTMFAITDGTTTDNNFSIGFLTETLSSALVENNNTNATPNYMSPLSGVRRRKVSLAAADNDAFGVTNGTLTSPKVNDILLPRNHAEAIIGGHLSYNSMNGTIRRITYWPQRLPDATLQALTL